MYINWSQIKTVSPINDFSKKYLFQRDIGKSILHQIEKHDCQTLSIMMPCSYSIFTQIP